jgi:hypothetical protein
MQAATPGPWYLLVGRNPYGDSHLQVRSNPEPPFGSIVHFAEDGSSSREQAETRLIALVPELAAVAEAARRFPISEWDCVTEPFCGDCLRCDLRDALAALDARLEESP